MSTAPVRHPRTPRLTLELRTPVATEAVFVDEAQHDGLLLRGARCTDIDAKGVELRQFELTDVDLSGARLDRVELQDGLVNGCNLANVKSRSCTFDRVEIATSRLTGAMLAEPCLTDVVFLDCPLDLSSFRFGRLNRVRFERCRLSEADFQGATAKACSFIDCDMTGAQLSQATFAGSAFRGCRLSGLSGVEALKRAQMGWEDVLELATTLAASLGIEIRDDIS